MRALSSIYPLSVGSIISSITTSGYLISLKGRNLDGLSLYNLILSALTVFSSSPTWIINVASSECTQTTLYGPS
jgi:hypothetical protein